MVHPLFHGSAICEVDAEGNVTVPDFLADTLTGEAGELVVAKHENERCLVAYERGHLKRLRARAERRRRIAEARGEDDREHERRMRRTFGLSDRLGRDADQLRIPAAMRHLGRIDDLALFVGTGDGFEIWNPDIALQDADDQFRSLAEFRLRTRRPPSSTPSPRPGVQ